MERKPLTPSLRIYKGENPTGKTLSIEYRTNILISENNVVGRCSKGKFVEELRDVDKRNAKRMGFSVE